MSAGHGGQILLSQEAADLVERNLPEAVSLKDLGQHHLKGLERSEHLFQVVADDLPRDFPSLPTAIQNPNNLPQEFTSFIGREAEIGMLAKQLREGKIRLLTLTGSGGTGKTRLSLKVAEQLLDAFPAGVWLVELAPLAEPELVVPTVAQVLGLREVSGTPLIQTLCSYLKNKRALIILDNCEHLLSACAELAGKLLVSGPEVCLFASSREILNVPGEMPFRVPSLPVPPLKPLPPLDKLAQYEAIRLFVERATQVSTGFALTDSTAQAVMTICRRLDGIPLAIELAASRVRMMPVQQIAARLDNVFRLLMGGARTVMPRQQTLKAAIDWSYNLLTAKEKMALQRLSVFSGGWTLEAVEQIIPDSPGKADCASDEIRSEEMLDLLASLMDKSLVILTGSESGEVIASSEPRYRMLETIRQYARDRLLEAGCGEAVRDRHLAYYLSFSEEAERHFRTKDQIHWLDQVDAELDNIRLALEWSFGGHLVEGMRLASALKWFWHICSHTVESNTWFDRLFALEAEERGDIPLAVGAQSNTYLLAWVRCVNALALDFLYYPIQITNQQILDMLELASALCRQIGPSTNRDLFWSLLYQGHLLFEHNHLPESEALKEEALQIARENHFRFEESEALFHRWMYCLFKSQDFVQGALYLEPSLAIVKEMQDVDGMAERMLGSVILTAFSGDLDRAKTVYDEAMAYSKLVNDLRNIHIWGIAFLRFSQDERAIRLANQAIQYFEERQDLNLATYGYSYLLQAEWSNGNIDRAIQLADHTLSLTNTIDETAQNQIFSLIFAGGLAAISGNLPKAYHDLQKAGRLIPIHLPVNVESRLIFLDILGSYAARSGNVHQAARILGASETSFPNLINLGFPWEIKLREETIQAVRLALGEEAFRSAWEVDQPLAFNQAFNSILEEFLRPAEQQTLSG
jgi:predicted ATPase